MRGGFFKATYLVAACAFLASCGGGGGGGDSDGSSRLTLTPSSIQVTQVQGREEDIQVDGSISPKPSGTQFFAVISADKPVVQTGPLFLVVNPDNSARVTMKTVRNLAVGTYDGQLTMRLCRDTECQDEVGLTGNVLPYSIKVIPAVQVQATGAEPMLGAAPNVYWANNGDTVVLTSNIPVTWATGSSSGAELEVISSTPTRWEGRILGTAMNSTGVLASSVEKPETNAVGVNFTIRRQF